MNRVFYFLASLLAAGAVSAQIDDGSNQVVASCYLGHVQPRADGTTTIDALVQFSIADGWHIYWENPGITGLPTTIRWKLPAGARAEGPFWSLPRVSEDPLMYSYAGETGVALFRLIVPAAFLKEGATISGIASFLVCREDCRNGEADWIATFDAAKLAKAKSGQPIDSEFDSLAAVVPRDALPKDFSLRWNLSPGRVVGTLTLPPNRKVESVAFLPNPLGDFATGPVVVTRKGERSFDIAVPTTSGAATTATWRGVLVFSGGDFPKDWPASRRSWIVAPGAP